MKEIRLLRSIGWIDNELILEADQARFRPRRWGHLLALAACLALVIAVPLTLHRQPAAQPVGASPEISEQSVNESIEKLETSDFADRPETPVWEQEYSEAAILQTETIGGLSLGMTEQEILDILSEPDAVSNVEMEAPDGTTHKSWFYKTGTNPDVNTDTQLGLATTGDGWFLNEILLHTGSALTLSTGIGCGSWIDQVEAAYPDAEHTQKTAVENDLTIVYDVYQVDDGLTITVRNGVSSIVLGPWLQMPPEEAWDTEPEPLPYDLTSGEITIYSFFKVWESVTAVDRAAKGISTVLTISEAEPVAETPESTPVLWLDFGNGTAAALLGDDVAAIYTYPDGFDVQNRDNLTHHLTGRFPGLDDSVQRAWDNPTLTWETENEGS